MQRARDAKGLSQRELGARIGLSQSVVSQIENGHLVLAPGLLPQLAGALDLDGDALQALLAAFGPAHWRGWIWASQRPPNEKLLLLALLDSPEQAADLAELSARTGLVLGSVRRLADDLLRQGLVRHASWADGTGDQLTLTLVGHVGDPPA
jgi:transcriptional regulator with XRE-family HTH domain